MCRLNHKCGGSISKVEAPSVIGGSVSNGLSVSFQGRSAETIPDDHEKYESGRLHQVLEDGSGQHRATGGRVQRSVS